MFSYYFTSGVDAQTCIVYFVSADFRYRSTHDPEGMLGCLTHEEFGGGAIFNGGSVLYSSADFRKYFGVFGKGGCGVRR
eukprot:7121570-Ditylum_brightwellii.AAC.1